MDDVTLVRLARSGDLAALARLFERHRPRLLAIGRGVLGDEDAVAEVVQETALVALTQLQQLRDPALVGAWLAGIARNLCVPIAATSDPGFDTLGSMRQWVESIIDAIKGQLGLENHGGRTMQGCSLVSRSVWPAPAAVIWFNWQLHMPGRHLVAYNH